VNEKLEAIRAWFAEYAGNTSIETRETPDGPQFVLHRGEVDWSVVFTYEFLDSIPADRLPGRLSELNLIGELTAVEDLPLVVESSGVRLLSNN